MLTDVFESFCSKCIEIYELDPTHLLSAPGLAWQASLKKTEFADRFRYIIMVEKVISGVMFHKVQWYAKANNKYMKDYDPNKESSYLIYRNVNNLYGWVISQKLRVDDFE